MPQKVFVITGITSGIGKALAADLAKTGEEVPDDAQDRTAQQRLWEISERLTGLATTQGVTPINDPHLS